MDETCISGHQRRFLEFRALRDVASLPLDTGPFFVGCPVRPVAMVILATLFILISQVRLI